MTMRFEIKNKTAEAIRKTQSPPGSLGLPELLDKRRVEFAIPDGAFRSQAIYDRIYCWQIPDQAQETYGSTSILKPESKASRERDEAPRGVLVSAGLAGQDHLRANGVELGHIVQLLRLAPWKLLCDNVDGKDQYLLVLRDGDLIGSEDLRQDLRERPEAIELHGATHLFRDRDGVLWTPTVPEIPDDY